jgi:hypothetical protein
MRFAIVISLLFTVACRSVNQEDVGECLEWKMSMIETKERLPYPMRGIVVREEMVAVCMTREEIDA